MFYYRLSDNNFLLLFALGPSNKELVERELVAVLVVLKEHIVRRTYQDQSNDNDVDHAGELLGPGFELCDIFFFALHEVDVFLIGLIYEQQDKHRYHKIPFRFGHENE